MKIKYKTILLTLSIILLRCEHRSSLILPELNGGLNIQITIAKSHFDIESLINKKKANQRGRSDISLIRIQIFEKDRETLVNSEDYPMNGDSVFERTLTIQAGDDRVIIVEAFDDGVVVYKGETSDVDIAPGDIVTIEINIYPIAVPGTIILIIEDDDLKVGSSDNHLSLQLRNADRLLGLQFDLAYDPAILLPDSISRGVRCRDFSDCHSNIISNGLGRMLLYDINKNEIDVGDDVLLKIYFSIVSNSAAITSIELLNVIASDSDRNAIERVLCFYDDIEIIH